MSRKGRWVFAIEAAVAAVVILGFAVVQRSKSVSSHPSESHEVAAVAPPGRTPSNVGEHRSAVAQHPERPELQTAEANTTPPEGKQPLVRPVAQSIPRSLAPAVPAVGEQVAALTQIGDVAAVPSESSPQRVMALLRSQCDEVNKELAQEQGGVPREDLLAMYGGSSMASGRFDVAAAAYAMFLEEFGSHHAYSGEVAQRLAESLAPLDLDNVSVLHTPEGPRYQVSWKMQHEASADRLRLAVAAYEFVSEIVAQPEAAERARLAIGWLYRALNDWTASTAAWDRCAQTAASGKITADALWLASENLQWTGQPTAAAERLAALITRAPDDPRVKAAEQQIEMLEAEARREGDWSKDPVASLQAEIAARAAARKPDEVYASVREWLRRRGDQQAMVAVGRWAITQSEWPITKRIACHFDLASALLQRPEVTEEQKQEAADVLAEIVMMAPDDDWAMQAGLRRSRVLRELGQFGPAEEMLVTLEGRANGSVTWGPQVMCERIRLLLDRGDRSRAKALGKELEKDYPGYELPAELKESLTDPTKGGAK